MSGDEDLLVLGPNINNKLMKTTST